MKIADQHKAEEEMAMRYARIRKPSPQPKVLESLPNKDGTLEDLWRLGGKTTSYIRPMSAEEARKRFPAVENIPDGKNLFALYSAMGIPLALTDSRQVAIGEAASAELSAAYLN